MTKNIFVKFLALCSVNRPFTIRNRLWITTPGMPKLLKASLSRGNIVCSSIGRTLSLTFALLLNTLRHLHFCKHCSRINNQSGNHSQVEIRESCFQSQEEGVILYTCAALDYIINRPGQVCCLFLF